MASWKPRQKALSVRARSAGRAPRGEAFAAGRHGALPKVQQPTFSCTPHSSGQTTPPAEGRLGDHAVGRQPRTPRPGGPEFSRAPSRRWRVICKVAHPGKLVTASFKVRESCVLRCAGFKVFRSSGMRARASFEVRRPGCGATDGGRAWSEVHRQRSRRRERGCGSRVQTASRGWTPHTHRAHTHRLGARERDSTPCRCGRSYLSILALGRLLAFGDRDLLLFGHWMAGARECRLPDTLAQGRP